MHEQALNGIIHLFAIFASLEGRSGEQATRLVESYLIRALGLHTPGVYLGLFSDLLELYAGSGDVTKPRQGVDAICAQLAPCLSRDDRQNFLLQALQFRRLLAAGDPRPDRLLERASGRFQAPPDEWENERLFLAADAAGPDAPSVRRLTRPGWRGQAVVFYSAWTNRYFLRALGGRFTLDENPLDDDRIYPLETGAILRAGGGQAVYVCEIEQLFHPPVETSRIVFEAEHVVYRFPGTEIGLHDLSFRETGGRLIGVMGGSGVGKSTLIDILNGNRPPDTGRIAVNGIDLYRHPESLEGVMGYVPQDDLLFEDLTVRENLEYNARLCLAHFDPPRRKERVRQILRELNQEDVADLKVGHPLSKTISGGQRKRLNIALELIREPSILFVDEPTSGLSSADSDMVMGLLKAQAARGRLVIVIVHQPSSAIFRLFDALWILDCGGYPIYMGHPLEAARHFRETAQLAGADQSICSECGNVNPEQLFSIVESRALDANGKFSRERRYPPRFWHEAWQRVSPPPAPASTPAEPPPRRLTRPSWPGQWMTFFSRTARARLANRAYLSINLIEPPLLGLITAWLCRSNPDGTYVFGANPYAHIFFFMAVIVALFLGLSVSAEEIVRDRRILRRERFLHLSWSAYGGAKMTYIALLALFQSGVCAAIGILLLGIPNMLLPLWATLFATAVFGGFLGLNVSAAFASAVTVYILIPLLLIPQMLLGGLIIAYEDLRSPQAADACPPILGEVMASRWALEALVIEQYQSNEFQRRFHDIDRDLSRLDYTRNDLIPALIGRLDALYLDTASPSQREATRRLLLHELARLDRDLDSGADLALAADRLQPPDRTGLEDLKSSLRELAQHLTADRQDVQTRRHAEHSLLLEEHGEAGMAEWVKRHSNRKIDELARNKSQLAPYRIRGERIVQLSDPVYQRPVSRWGRAPFMAGTKRVGPFVLRTFPFNLMVLWIMNAALALLLMLPRRRRS